MCKFTFPAYWAELHKSESTDIQTLLKAPNFFSRIYPLKSTYLTI